MAGTEEDIQAKLAPPGKGLPMAQALFLRHLFFPAYCWTTSWDKALARFMNQGNNIVSVVESLSAEQLQTRVLINAPLGVEDSSRYWSAGMVLEHLIEVGSRIAVGVVELTNRMPVTVKADIADVKPRGGAGTEIVQDYRQFLDDYFRIMSDEVGDRTSKNRHTHPWFGDLTAHQWVCLGAIHQSVHREQLLRIDAGRELEC